MRVVPNNATYYLRGARIFLNYPCEGESDILHLNDLYRIMGSLMSEDRDFENLDKWLDDYVEPVK